MQQLNLPASPPARLVDMDAYYTHIWRGRPSEPQRLHGLADLVLAAAGRARSEASLA